MDILITMPTAWPFIEDINTDILNGELYKALKSAKKLIAYTETQSGNQEVATTPRRARA